MLEIAIISTKCALRDEFPEYMEFYLARPWEKKEEPTADDAPTESAPLDGSADLSADGTPTDEDNALTDNAPAGVEGPIVSASPDASFKAVSPTEGETPDAITDTATPTEGSGE